MSKENKNLTTVGKSVVRSKGYNEYETYDDGVYVENRDKAGKAGRYLEAAAEIFRKVLYCILKIFTCVRDSLKKVKKAATAGLVAEAGNLSRRLPVIKTAPFLRKFASSMAVLGIYSILCSMIATKNGSTDKYLETYFVVLIICGLLVFAAAFLNPHKPSATVYATLTSLLIITGVLLQVMLIPVIYERTGVLNDTVSLINNMLLGIAVGGVGALGVVFILRSPKKKLWVILVAALTLLITVFLAFFGSKINGASNWGEVLGKSFQLSEIVKVMAVFVIACIYSFKDWHDKRKILLSAAYLIVLSALFAKCNEFGTVVILMLAYLIISMLSLYSAKRFMYLILWGSAALLLVLGVSKICYDKTYDISKETVTTMESLELEAYKTITGDSDATIETVRDSELFCLRQEDSAVVPPTDDTYLSYSCYIAEAGVNDDEALGKQLTKRQVMTFGCKGDKNQELFDRFKYLLKNDAIGLDENVTAENFVVLEDVNGYHRFSFTLVCTKSVEEYGSLSLLASKIYFKLIKRLGVSGSQYHANKIREALRMTNWLGAEGDNNLIYQIPEIQNDSIFSYALLQLGFAMIIIILVVYLVKFLLVLFNIFALADTSLAMVAIGFSVCISVQSLIQLAMCFDVFPIMGMCTAWLSSGGTNFMINICMTLVILYSMRSGTAVKSFEEAKEV